MIVICIRKDNFLL